MLHCDLFLEKITKCTSRYPVWCITIDISYFLNIVSYTSFIAYMAICILWISYWENERVICRIVAIQGLKMSLAWYIKLLYIIDSIYQFLYSGILFVLDNFHRIKIISYLRVTTLIPAAIEEYLVFQCLSYVVTRLFESEGHLLNTL